jgi:hypothetical protein
MRELTSHKVNGVNDGLTVTVMDEPGSGGANHRYQIGGYSRKQEVVTNSETGETEIIDDIATDINFQDGPLKESGINGITHEVLLAILIDRLEGFQRGPFACEANELALLACRTAQKALKDRTVERLARGVEGTHRQ